MELIGPGLFRLRSGGFAAPYLILCDVPTLIDAGAPGRGAAIESELQAAGVRIERIILTHGDPDHIGGCDHLRRITGAQVWASAAERAMIDRSGWQGLPRARRGLMRAFFRRTQAPVIDRWLDAGGDFDGLRVIPTPGHTPGHIALMWEGWLLAGDAFRTGARFRESPGVFTIDRTLARRSIETLLELAPDAAASSHGRPTHAATARLQALVSTWR